MGVALNLASFLKKLGEDIISFPLPRLKNPLEALLFPTPLLNNSIIYFGIGRALPDFYGANKPCGFQPDGNGKTRR